MPGYDELARHLLGEVKDREGPDRMAEVLRGMAARIAQEGPAPTPGQRFEDRLDQV